MRFVAMCVICAAMIRPGGATQDVSGDAHRLWQEMIAAKGGHERLQSIHGLVFATARKLEGFSRRDVAGGLAYEVVAEFPDRIWWWEDYRPGSMGFGVQVWNRAKEMDWTAQQGRVAGPPGWGAGRTAMMERNLGEWQLAYLLENKYAEVTPVRVSPTADDPQKTAILEVGVPRFADVHYRVNLATHLPISLMLTGLYAPSGGGAPQVSSIVEEYVFDGWVTVAGLQMPKRVRINGGWTNIQFLINPDVDPKLFETPPDGVTQADAWKKFLRKDPAKH